MTFDETPETEQLWVSDPELTSHAIAMAEQWLLTRKQKFSNVLTDVYGTRAGEVLALVPPVITAQAILALPQGDRLMATLEELYLEKMQHRKDLVVGKYYDKVANALQYMPSPTLIVSPRDDGNSMLGHHYRFETVVAPPGLMEEYLVDRGADPEEIYSIQVINRLPVDAETERQYSIDSDQASEVWRKLDEWAVTPSLTQGMNPGQLSEFVPCDVPFQMIKGKVLWRWTDEVKEWFSRAFSEDKVLLTAYGQRLRAPLLPDGLLKNIPVEFWQQQTSAGTVQGVDGSGLYNPDHPLMKALVSRYGKVVFQFTLIHEDGTFAKGIVVPREGLPELGFSGPIVLDHDQVKGAQKDRHALAKKEGRRLILEDCYFGVMKTWKNKLTLPMGFEHFENIEVNHETSTIVKKLARKAMRRLLDGGIDALIASAVRQDQNLKIQVDMINTAKLICPHLDIHPLGLETVAGAVKDKLRKKLYSLQQGAIVDGRQMVLVMDDTLKKGEIVMEGQVGTEMGVWRWPNIIPAGLLTGKLVEPSPHHLIDGKVIKNAIFLSLRDTAVMQGDDDGDIIGVTSNPDILKLWKYRLNDTWVNIEPQGVKRVIHWDSPEGMEYGSTTDPRGPVGLTTVWLAELRCVGDRQAAMAMAVMNQEAIDQAKRQVEYTDWNKLCPFRPGKSAIKDSEGRFVFHFEGSSNTRRSGTDENFPQKDLAKWRQERLITAGVGWRELDDGRIVLTQPVLGWRIHHETIMVGGEPKQRKLTKRCDYTQWKPTIEKQKGCTHHNLVHVIADTCLETWLEMGGEEMMRAAEQPCDLYGILPAVCKAKGIPWAPVPLEWKTFEGLMRKAGITQYKADIKSVMANTGVEAKALRIDHAYKKMTNAMAQVGIVELQAMWEMIHQPWMHVKIGRNRTTILEHEVLDQWREDGKVYAAVKPLDIYRALATERSWWSQVIAETTDEKCSFLDTLVEGGKWDGAPRLQATMGFLQKQENPALRLAEMVANNTSHAKEIKDENGHGIEMWQCTECRERLRYALASTMRGMRDSKTQEFLRRMTTTANQAAKLVFEPVYGKSQKKVTHSEQEWEETYEQYQDDDVYASYE